MVLDLLTSTEHVELDFGEGVMVKMIAPAELPSPKF